MFSASIWLLQKFKIGDKKKKSNKKNSNDKEEEEPRGPNLSWNLCTKHTNYNNNDNAGDTKEADVQLLAGSNS